MPEIENEDAAKLRKRRPERQLYVPPAQRRSSIKDSVKTKSEHVDRRNKVKERNGFNHEEKKKTARDVLSDINGETKKCDSERCLQPVVNKFSILLDYYSCSYFLKSNWECEIGDGFLKFTPASKLHVCLNVADILGEKYKILLRYFISEYRIIQYPSSPLVLDNLENIFLWKTTLRDAFPLYDIRKYFRFTRDTLDMRLPFCRNFFEPSLNILEKFTCFCEHDGYFIQNNFHFDKDFLHILKHQFLWENLLKEKYELENIMTEIIFCNDTSQKREKKREIIIKEKNTKDNCREDPSASKKDRKSKIDGHEEELEIMRKTQENINRKIRPIIKYVPDTNDTLNIDDVKDWEDLFNDNGEIKKEFLSKDKRKENKSVVRTTGSYDEDIKEIEELEHMVELYNFPSSFKTNDLIQTFNNIESDAMYIKWVDETHAILVLGSLTQATKAINLNNPLVKVRPMSAASKSALSVAFKNDLKPAMKRPQTNLQTARRFITAHLGTKVAVSKEKMAKERDDLRVAREMKKLARQNERDAWEGNLKSTIH